MSLLSTDQYTAFIGIDWANSKHDVCVQAADSQQREFDCIVHQVDRIEQWAQSIHQRFGGTIAIALELSKGPIVYALQKYDFSYSSRSIQPRWQNTGKPLNPVVPKMIPPMRNLPWICYCATGIASNRLSHKVLRCERSPTWRKDRRR